MTNMASNHGNPSNHGNQNCEQESIAEVTVIDSQFQHFSSYIDVIRVFKCRLCTFCSPLEHVIASHMSEVHFPRRQYLCKQCLFVFEDRDQLTSHLESAHGTKSINVCFGDTPNYASPRQHASPPPSWRVSRSEDDGMARLTVGDERGLDEGRNGRVTSSTGNLANIRDDDRDSPNQAERLQQQQQQQQQQASEGSPPSSKYLGNGSCHPSSSSQEDCEIVGTQPAKDLAPGETPIQRQENEDYIKAEPVSPVRRYFPPRISIESPDQPRVETLSRQGSLDPQSSPGNHGNPEPVVSRASRMLSRSTTIALSPTDKGEHENELALARPVQPGFTSYIIRQSSFDTGEDSCGMSAGTPPDHNAERARPQQQESAAVSAPVDPRLGGQSSGGQSSPAYKPKLGSRLMTIRRQESIEEGRYGQGVTSEEPPTPPASRPTAEVPPVTQREPVTQVQPVTQGEVIRNRSHRLTFKEMANQMLENQEKRSSLDPSQPLSLDLTSGGAFPGAAALQRAGRPRSFSISEGDTRALYGGLNAEYPPAMAAVRVPGAASTERERPLYGPHLQPGWHPYPGLVYQSLSVDAGASKYWRYPGGGQRSISMMSQDEPLSQQDKRSEGGSMEGSVLYQALQNSETNSKGQRKRNPAQGAEGARPSPPWQHSWAQRRGIPDMAQRMPWSHGSPPFPMLSQRESSVESLPPTSQKSSDTPQVFHHKRFRSMERSASEGHNSMANPHRKVGGQGISSESSQDLAQADDITRQVQQVMEGSNTLYTSRDRSHDWSRDRSAHWSEEQNSPQSGQGEGEKEDARRRSRKSTFNIYREIPERKRKLDRDEEEKIKHSYNPDGSFDYFTLTGWKAYKCELCKKRRFKTASELEDHKRRKHGSIDAGSSAGSPLSTPTNGTSAPSMSATSNTSTTTSSSTSVSTVTPPTTSSNSLTTASSTPPAVGVDTPDNKMVDTPSNRMVDEAKSNGSG